MLLFSLFVEKWNSVCVQCFVIYVLNVRLVLMCKCIVDNVSIQLHKCESASPGLPLLQVHYSVRVTNT